MEPTLASKLIFHYKIYNNTTHDLLCTGKTIQVFVSNDGELQLTNPDFFVDWKNKWLK
jgi:acyl-CoA thioester hydrolase